MSWKSLFDDLMEAATFAEENQPEAARAIASRIFPEERGRRTAGRILAVSGGAGFSPAMVERSLAMASRLDYGLVAMTIGEARRRLSRRRDLSGQAFGERAAERGVPFSHVAWPGDPAEGVVEASRRLRRVAFLLVESEIASRLSAVRVGIPLFRLEE